jgi:hypothetical protein
MTPRLLVWLFPFLMVIFEFLMRSGMRDPGAFDFIGPTLGGGILWIAAVALDIAHGGGK